MVAAALIEGGIPAREYKTIIIPSTVPNPPGSKGIIPTKVEIINTAATNSKDIGTSNAEKTI